MRKSKERSVKTAGFFYGGDRFFLEGEQEQGQEISPDYTSPTPEGGRVGMGYTFLMIRSDLAFEFKPAETKKNGSK